MLNYFIHYSNSKREERIYLNLLCFSLKGIAEMKLVGKRTKHLIKLSKFLFNIIQN